MRLLLDSCVWGAACRVLTDLGHDVEWTGDWERDPGDTEILAYAHREDRILVTLDKDFGELVVVRELPHPGIIRLVGFSAREQASICHRLLVRYREELLVGALVTAGTTRVRVRPGPPGSDGAS